METYNPRSCNALQKPYYRPIEAAIRWCGLINHESEILGRLGEETHPQQGRFPQWPCLIANTELIWDAINNEDIPKGRDGVTVNSREVVARHRVTVRHIDLREWIAKKHPDKKPAFLFDETERNTHPAINADSFRALQADRDALRTERDALKEEIEKAKVCGVEIVAERDALRAKVDVQSSPGARAESTYRNIIGGLLGLMLGTTTGGQRGSVYASQEAIISALLAHHGDKQGIAKSTLEQKFADANRSIKAT